jgi:hypothetical protein
LQSSEPSSLKSLQSQNLPRPENRLSLNALAIVHGRLTTELSAIELLTAPSRHEAFDVGTDTKRLTGCFLSTHDMRTSNCFSNYRSKNPIWSGIKNENFG